MAKKKSINVILNLEDNISTPMKQIQEQQKQFDRQVKRVSNNVVKNTEKITKGFKNMAKQTMKSIASISFKGLKFTTGAAFAGATAAGTLGVFEGMDYEKYKVQLETATKDTKRASELMKKAIKLANATPFETGQMIEATAIFESMGLSSEKWLAITADMAGATSKDIIQAVEAIVDAVASGEFERLKEFGIKKDSLAGFNLKGQLVDQNAMVDSLLSQMESRFKGGAVALSKTTSGMWSTVTGVFKNSMAKIVGVTDEGTVRVGSFLDRIRNNVAKVAERLQQWQEDGTIERISAKIDAYIGKAITTFKVLAEKIKGVIDAFKNNETLQTWLKVIRELTLAIGYFYIANKAGIAILKLKEMWTNRAVIAQGLLNGVTTMWNKLALATPWLGVLSIIVGLVILVWRNWDKVSASVTSAWNTIKDGFRTGVNFCIDKLNSLINVFNKLLSFKLPNWIPFLGGKGLTVNVPTIPNFATGTSYFKGGIAEINEGGRGEIVNLPNGTQIIPNSISKKTSNNVSVNVNLSINGDVLGEQGAVTRIANIVGQKIAKHIQMA